jgi:hypothetical protein
VRFSCRVAAPLEWHRLGGSAALGGGAIASLPGPMYSIVGVPGAAVAQGRGPVEVEQRGSRAGSMLPTEEGAASINLMASQRDAMRPLVWSR